MKNAHQLKPGSEDAQIIKADAGAAKRNGVDWGVTFLFWG